MDDTDFRRLWNGFDSSFDEDECAGVILTNDSANRGRGSENYVDNARLISQDQLLAIDSYINDQHEVVGRTVRLLRCVCYNITVLTVYNLRR
jgi:hypothetical protein